MGENRRWKDSKKVAFFQLHNWWFRRILHITKHGWKFKEGVEGLIVMINYILNKKSTL